MGINKLNEIAYYENRADALRDERDLVERFPGPLNREPWAGKKSGEGLGAIIPLAEAIVSCDPISAGIELGNLINPSVQEAAQGYTNWTMGGRAGINPRDLVADIYGS